MKELFGGIAFVLTIAMFVPYIRAVRHGAVVPHVFSWLIWACGTFVVFLAQLAAGGGLGAWPVGLSACITGYIAVLSYRRKAQIDIVRLDWILLALALPAIPAWVIAADPLLAVVLLTSADLLGFGPTLRKAYRYPHQEHVTFFALGAVRNTLIVLALESYSWTTLLFPVAVAIACLVVTAMLLLRRTVVPRPMSVGSDAR